MPRSPLLNKIVSIARLAAQTPDKNIDFDEAMALRDSRRRFLKAAAAGAVVASGGMPALSWACDPAKVRVAIVGAGLAGLRAAYELKKHGIPSTVYEANTRIGGRCYTNRAAFCANIVENGGELIDSGHKNIRKLARELGLKLDDLEGWTEKRGLDSLYYFDGKKYTLAEAFKDYQKVASQLDKDAEAAPFPQLWDNHTPRGVELDNMTLAAYITTYVPGGMTSKFGKLLDVAYTIEFGAQTSQQSAYNLVSMLGGLDAKKPEDLMLFGESDERFHIRGGNDQLVTRMAAKLKKDQIVMGHELKKIVLNDDTSYTLTFAYHNSVVEVLADHVVLAIPFSIMRAGVDFTRAGFDERKVRTINTMPMGNSCKFQLQFKRRVWHDKKCSGETMADTGFQNTWEPTRVQATQTACINNFTGGETALQYAEAGDLDVLAKSFLAQWEKLIPGSTKQWNGKRILNAWPKNQWTKGSYGYYAPGNYTAFVGYEGERQGNCHFCGEHTSIEAQGYLEGAVETGERCAKEVIKDLGHVKHAARAPQGVTLLSA